VVALTPATFAKTLSMCHLLNERVNHAIALAARAAKKVAVLFLDLKGFKHINHSLGHTIGDKLLQSVPKTAAGVYTRYRHGQPPGLR
jgi:diguanylate cyclase (GGDEF)-like protein